MSRHAAPTRTLTRAPGRSIARAFTLAELLVAAIVGSMLVAATSSGLAMLLSARERAVARQEAFSRADHAASRIAQDAAGLQRDSDLYQCLVTITDSGDGPPSDSLLLRARSMRQLRGSDEASEGGQYVFEYRLGPHSLMNPAMCLWRRADSAFRTNADIAGLAARVVEGVETLSVEGYDGEAWVESWDSDSDGLPHAIRVTVSARSANGKVTATSRRVIAIDRVPVPPPEEVPESTTPTTPATPEGGTQSPQTPGQSPSPGGGRTIEIPAPPRPTPAPAPNPGGGGGTPRPTTPPAGGAPRGGGG